MSGDNQFTPIQLGEYAQDSYAEYLLGGNQRGYQGLLQAFEQQTDNPEESLIRSKGPFLQGVPSAEQSGTPWPAFADQVTGDFAPTGLEPTIVQAFRKSGFQTLFTHQEEAIESLVNDSHALISAGTGRGKTEAWFIPLLQYTLRAKRKPDELPGANPEGVKAIITYPTKALAQDQLKRFIRYLWLVNKETDLPDDQALTIGVFDGDTPTHGIRKEGMNTHEYLEKAFKYFEVPDEIAEEVAPDRETYEEVPPRVNVVQEPGTSEYNLTLREEYGGHKLEFVQLTRDSMRDDPPDILLTNPDTVNYRLFNVNNEKERYLFIDQPKFLVFDEVHTYEGLFGAHVSMLIKRLRQLREERNIDTDLRVVASSATMDRKEEFFQQLFSVRQSDEYDVIEEDIDDAVARPGSIRRFLADQWLDRDVLEAEIKEYVAGTPPEENEWITSLSVDPTDCLGGEEFLEKALQEDLKFLSHLHSVLQDPGREEHEIADAPQFEDFVEYIAATYDLTSETAETVAHNALMLFELAGLEVRVHLFNWPIDGYYKCVQCHSLYTKPQRCDCVDDRTDFVTKIRLDDQTGEHVYEGWYCIDCGYMQPVRQETEGEYLYATKPECPHPQHQTPLIRVYWQPEYICQSCGKRAVPDSALENCTECGAKLTRTSDGIICKNPDCQAIHQEASSNCKTCGGDIELQQDTVTECSSPDCEQYHDNGDGHGSDVDGEAESPFHCAECDAPLVARIQLPWTCTDETCDERYYTTEPPERCDCGTRTFGLKGYLDTNEADFCVDCNADRSTEVYHVAGTGCAIDGHNEIRPAQESFGLRVAYADTSGNIRLDTPSRLADVLPWYHGRSTSFDPLLRAPTSTGVTMSQFMLRRLASTPAGQRNAKLISFADSYRDMERLNNDFDEPEKLLFAQQVLLSVLEDQGTLTIEEAFHQSQDTAEEYWESLDTNDDIIDDIFGYLQWRGTIVGELLQGSYRRFRGTFERSYADLVRYGLLDISFEQTPDTAAERAACRLLLEQNGRRREKLVGKLRDNEGVSNPMDTISTLEEKGYVSVDGSPKRVNLEQDALTVHFVGEDHAIPYDPFTDRFISTGMTQVSDENYTTVPFDVPYAERVDPDSPYFTRIAYQAASSPRLFMLSQVYKGDIEATERRRLEHEFKRTSVPNFLSSGPAMEVGIDIGDLNTLLLNGTPPNTNAYLQRIGRAGRRENKSLVTTVSKRNPIDFYYHKRPEQLITSEEKPIPLDPHNEQALKVELTWAIVDYISTSYHIPWKQRQSMDDDGITIQNPTDWDQYAKDDPRAAPPDEFKSFTQVYNSNVTKVNHGQILTVFHYIVHGTNGIPGDEQIQPWLKNLLDYSYCQNCSRIYRSEVTGQCQECLNGSLHVAYEEYSHVIDDVLENFTDRVVRFAYDYKEELEGRREALEDERSETKQKLDELEADTGFFDEAGANDEEIAELQHQIERIDQDISTVQELQEDYRESDLNDVHDRSAVSGFVPGLRSFSETVAVTRHWKNRDTGKVRSEDEENLDRQSAMAIRELFPYAHKLWNKGGYIVTSIEEDTEKTDELHQIVGTSIRCGDCGFTESYDGQTSCPECGADIAQLNKVRPVALRRVDLTEEDIESNDTKAKDIYPFSNYNTRPESTYPHSDSEISDFESEQTPVQFTDGNGNPLVQIDYGTIDLVESVDSFTTTYSNGQQDPTPQPIKLCRERHCNSVVIRNRDGDDVCLADPAHDVNQQEYVSVGRSFRTKGLQIKAESPTVPDSVLHAVAHGLRMALQRVGGVGIRDLKEVYDYPDIEAYLLEAEAGGNGVTQLLLNRNGDTYPELEESIAVILENIERCECDHGCPECLYQYGCDENNSEKTLSKNETADLLERVDIQTAVDD